MPYARKTIECETCGDTIQIADAFNKGGVPFCSDCLAEAQGTEMPECKICQKELNPLEAFFFEDDIYCETCYHDLLPECHECESTIFPNTGHTVDGFQYCESCYNSIFVPCCICGEILDRDMTLDTPSNETSIYCEECWEDRFAECWDCGRIIRIEDGFTTNDSWSANSATEYLCSGCSPNHIDYWNPDVFAPTSNSFNRVGSNRCFGLELEFNNAPGASSSSLTHFGCKDEHCGCEFWSAILKGDKGLESIENFVDFSVDNDWQVDDDCGYHLHLDMRDETFSSLISIAYAYRKTYHLWRRFVNNWRADNCSYCHQPRYTAEDIRSLVPTEFERWAYRSQRFLFVNWQAYGDHTTMEVRLHQGTNDVHEVVNWVKAHIRFADWASNASLEDIDRMFSDDVINDFESLAEIWNDPDLTSFYRRKAEFHGKPVTRQPVSRRQRRARARR